MFSNFSTRKKWYKINCFRAETEKSTPRPTPWPTQPWPPRSLTLSSRPSTTSRSVKLKTPLGFRYPYYRYGYFHITTDKWVCILYNVRGPCNDSGTDNIPYLHYALYRQTSLYAIDASQTKLAYNEFAYNESNRKPK